MSNPYTFTDNPMVSGVSICNTDIVNDNIMALKWMYDHISFRKIGEIVTSTIPLADAGLHLLDGALIDGSGIYHDFVDYIRGLTELNTLYAWEYTYDGVTHTIYSDESTVTSTTKLYNANGSPYYGSQYEVYNSNGTYKIRWRREYVVTKNWYGWKTNSADSGLPRNTVFYTATIPTDNHAVSAYSTPNTKNGYNLLYNSSLNSYLVMSATASAPVAAECSRMAGSDTTTSSTVSTYYNMSYNSSDNIEVPAENYFCTEVEWQQSVTDYGVCGKFVYDSTNNTVRLPKITGIVEGTTDLTALGDLVEAGLPNITGYVAGNNLTTYEGPPYSSGSLYFGGNSYIGPDVQGDKWGPSVNIDASLSSSIYGNSSTVQPQTIKVLYYIVISTSIKSPVQVDVDEIATDLNGKADTDLSNVPSSKGILTENYINGTSWYRVYSDGWCIQGGSVSVTSGSSATVTLLKEYTNTNYSLLATSNVNYYSQQEANSTAIKVSTAQIAIYSGSHNTGNFSWQTSGYIN